MLTITIPQLELYDEKKSEFVYKPEVTLELEHSLVSLSKWESTWEKPFLGPDPKTTEETIDYVRAMTLTKDVPPETYHRLSNDNITQINKYIDAKMSATWFTEPPGSNSRTSRRREIITSEVIYYWIISLNINWECQHWHLNRLFTLIKVCNQKNAPEKKMSRKDLIAQRNMLNAKRKSEMQSSG